MSATDEAWDALPPQEETTEATWDPTPEAAALRALFGASAFRLLGNAGCSTDDRELDAATAVQEHIAKAYLYARNALLARPVERCLFCGTSVTPGQLIGNTLANGAMPKMAEAALTSARLYTDELGALRKRVAELEVLHEQAGSLIDRLSSVAGAGGVLLQAVDAGPAALWPLFAALRTKLAEADVCLACGDHTPGRSCQCENDE